MNTSEFDDVLKKLNPESTKYLLETYGDEAGIAQAAQRKVNNISAAAASKDPAQTADQVMVEAGEQPTDAAKIDFAENVFGLEDVNDIDEINRRIANVAIGSSVAKSPDEFAQAVLLGLQTFKQTASARAAAKTGGSGGGYEPMKRYAEALPAMINNIMSSNPGTTIQEAAQQAASVLDPLYGKTAGAGAGAGAGGEEKRVTMYDPSGKPFYSTDGTNFVDADGNPYVPPATA
jgi:hypothetical protein